MAMFRKKDIKPGMVVVLRDGSRRLVKDDGVLVMDPTCGAKYAFCTTLHLDEYCDRLLHPLPGYDIMAVWDAATGPLCLRSPHEI